MEMWCPEEPLLLCSGGPICLASLMYISYFLCLIEPFFPSQGEPKVVLLCFNPHKTPWSRLCWECMTGPKDNCKKGQELCHHFSPLLAIQSAQRTPVTCSQNPIAAYYGTNVSLTANWCGFKKQNYIWSLIRTTFPKKESVDASLKST